MLEGHVAGGHIEFGANRVPGADHLEEGSAARAFVRPHDVRLVRSDEEGSVEAIVDRIIRLGWLSQLTLRLPDGQQLIAQVPKEETQGISPGARITVNLRNTKAFEAADPAETEAIPAKIPV